MKDDQEQGSHEAPVIDWYLARDGQQYGPLSDMKKFNELGHLRSTDLVWRNEFSDWTRAGAVFEIVARMSP